MKDTRLTQLESLEKTIIKTTTAYEQRNALIYELVRDGHKQADICRMLNGIRTKLKAPQLTPDAISATVTRYKQRHTQ